ncbi:hypothetical protein Ancab_020416, partial [Ancistrocladus abbreviatus]
MVALQGKLSASAVVGKEDVGISATGTKSDSPEAGKILFIEKGQGELAKDGCRGSSSGDVESGADHINGSINGVERDLLPELVVPESSSMPAEPSETGWILNLGLRASLVSQNLGMDHKQNEIEENRREASENDPKSPKAGEGSPKLGTQDKNGPLLSPINIVAGNSLKLLDRESQEEAVALRAEMALTRKTRKKSLVEISCSKLSIGRSGCRSKWVPRQIMNTWDTNLQLSRYTEGSGIDLHDSQIVNMNHVFCKQDSIQAEMELSPTPGQIWRFLTWIGVKENSAEKDIVNCIKSMEQRDLKNFLETVQVQDE